MLFRNPFKKRKHYDYVISLGYNCEIAHKFLKYYKFEISNLFNWTFSYSLDDLIAALQNFDMLGAGDWHTANPLWECANTHIRFHGKAPMQGYIDGNITQKEIDADKTELISRVKYLKEKFLNIAISEKRKLYVYKIKADDIKNNIQSKISALMQALDELGAKNYQLMIVAEKKYADCWGSDSRDYILKFVDEFPPDNDVVNKKYRKNGWHIIFDELSVQKPKNYVKKKRYKYEKENYAFPDRFDLFFSIGEACSCTETLRKSRLQFYSYPLDWLYGASFVSRTKIVAANFENWLVKEHMEKVGDNNLSSEPKHVYENKITQICFNHDFPQKMTLDESFQLVKGKYDRRIKRLFYQIEQSKRVLVVYLQTPNNPIELTKEELLEGYGILRERFGEKMNLLYLFCDSNYDLEHRVVFNLNENIKCIKFDYNAYNKDVPYAVNRKLLVSVFNEFGITNKFLTNRNKFSYFFYRIGYFFRKNLWKKI